MAEAKKVNWFNANDLLSHNCLFNFIIGDRGGGKSFGTLQFCINRYIKYGEEFIYMRRYEQELDDSKPTMFDALKMEGKYPEQELKVKGNRMYCNDKVMGYVLALSTSMKKKSIPFPRVKWIIFEEFMVDGVTSRYLGHGQKEVEIFNNFYETVDRLRDETRVFFVANAFSMVNIYFTYFKIRLPEKPKRFNKYGPVMVCVWHDESYIEAKSKTQFYQMVKGTEYAEHAYGNKFYLDKKHFIKKRPSTTEFHFALNYLGKSYGVWVDWSQGSYFVTGKPGQVNSKKVVSLSLSDNRPNNVNIRRVKNMPFMKLFRRAVDENNVYYDKLETWSVLNEAVYLLRTIR